ncbi:MAG TPA: cupin domain-containing protein [Ignavibacteriaceae bacterium]|nr:cupin domain-containing protein [Ignavibacteriaceae bacterium]
MRKTAEYYIEKLGLLPHPEGGFFKETYRSNGIIKKDCLKHGYSGDRTFSTLIYFLLKGKNFSAMHRLKSDEIWHYYDGCSVKIVIINENGVLRKLILGGDLSKRESFQAVIPKNSWFGAELADKNSYALIGCTVSPGFEFEDFEIGKRKDLLIQFPEFEKEIKRLTKNE